MITSPRRLAQADSRCRFVQCASAASAGWRVRRRSRYVSAASDTFARFVGVLAETLDEPEMNGAGLAARLHLSRFHADRMVTALAGEPPGALRRRILLERAAYRLLAAETDLLHDRFRRGLLCRTKRSHARSSARTGARRRRGGR